MSEHGTDLVVVPHTGELVDLTDPSACAVALDELRTLEQRVRELKYDLTAAIAAASKAEGKKTLDLPGGIRVQVAGGSQVLWDIQRLEAGLREAGMSEERIGEIITTEIMYKVNATEAKRAASANPEYAAVVDGARSVVETRPTIKVERAVS